VGDAQVLSVWCASLGNSAGADLPFGYLRHGDQMLTSSPPRLVTLPAGAVAYSAINKNACELGEAGTAARIA
jgi:hypothetical protein